MFVISFQAGTASFTFSNHSALVDTNFVCFVRGCDADRVSALVDSGDLTWVWNVSEGAAIRELRFWVNEVFAPQMTARLSIDELIEKLLPASRQRFSTAEVRRLFLISRVKAICLCRQMNAAKEDHTFRVGRNQLVEFLRKRWIGGGCL